jgi:hypothetical protein
MIDKCCRFHCTKINTKNIKIFISCWIICFYILMNMSAECAFCFLNLKIQGTFLRVQFLYLILITERQRHLGPWLSTTSFRIHDYFCCSFSVVCPNFVKDFDKALSKYFLFDLLSAIKHIKQKKFEEIRQYYYDNHNGI